jgi:hypothetical protein
MTEKITAATLLQLLLERAAADVGMTLEQIRQELNANRVLLSIRFITTTTSEEPHHEQPDEAL